MPVLCHTPQIEGALDAQLHRSAPRNSPGSRICDAAAVLVQANRGAAHAGRPALRPPDAGAGTEEWERRSTGWSTISRPTAEKCASIERVLGRAGVGGVACTRQGTNSRNCGPRLVSRARELGTRGIYRGEPECFPRVSSGLYRQLYEIDDQYFDIGSAQQRRLELARRYAPHPSDDDVLTRLQHLGGKTNLIDFTRDLNIALFFASYHSPDKDGRVILMEEPPVRRDEGEMFASYKLVPRGNPASMTDVQKASGSNRASPNDWSMTLDGEISLCPSIGNRSFECQSHYYIRRNKVVWLRPFGETEPEPRRPLWRRFIPRWPRALMPG